MIYLYWFFLYRLLNLLYFLYYLNLDLYLWLNFLLNLLFYLLNFLFNLFNLFLRNFCLNGWLFRLCPEILFRILFLLNLLLLLNLNILIQIRIIRLSRGLVKSNFSIQIPIFSSQFRIQRTFCWKRIFTRSPLLSF